MISAWSSVASVTSQVTPERLEDAGDAFLLLHAVGGAGHLDRHPDEVARLHQALVDQVLRPALADLDQVAADIGVEAGARVGRVDVDDRDAGGLGLLDHLDQAARVGAAGDDAVGLGGDRGAHGLLVRRHVAAVERGVDRVAGVRRPLLGAGQEVGPDRVGRRAVRDPVEGLAGGLGRRGQLHGQRPPWRRTGAVPVFFSSHRLPVDCSPLIIGTLSGTVRAVYRTQAASSRACAVAKALTAPALFWILKIEPLSGAGGSGRRAGTAASLGVALGGP